MIIGFGLVMIGIFIVIFFSVSGVVYMFYFDMLVYFWEFFGGLEKEFGGLGVLRVSYFFIVV